MELLALVSQGLLSQSLFDNEGGDDGELAIKEGDLLTVPAARSRSSCSRWL